MLMVIPILLNLVVALAPFLGGREGRPFYSKGTSSSAPSDRKGWRPASPSLLDLPQCLCVCVGPVGRAPLQGPPGSGNVAVMTAGLI